MLRKEVIQANCVQCHARARLAARARSSTRADSSSSSAPATPATRSRASSYGSIGPELTEVGRKRRIDYVAGQDREPARHQSHLDHAEAGPDAPSRCSPSRRSSRRSRARGSAGRPSQQFRSAQQAATRVAAPGADRRARSGDRGRGARRGEAGRGAPAQGRLPLLPQARRPRRPGRARPRLSRPLQRDHDVAHDALQGPEERRARLDHAALSAARRHLRVAHRVPPHAPDADSSPTIPRSSTALCARCHGEKGTGDGVISRYLDPRPRDLTKASFMKTQDARAAASTSVTNGVPGTSMAPVGPRARRRRRSGRSSTTCLETSRKAAPREAAHESRGARHEPGGLLAGERRARRGDLPRPLLGLPRQEGRRPRPERGRHRAAAAQPPQHARS